MVTENWHLAEDFEILRLARDFEMLRLTCYFKTLRLTPARRQPDATFQSQAQDFKIMRQKLFSVTMRHTNSVRVWLCICESLTVHLFNGSSFPPLLIIG